MIGQPRSFKRALELFRDPATAEKRDLLAERWAGLAVEAGLHFLLDTRRPDVIRSHGHGAPGRRPSLRDVVRDKLRGRVIESDLSREALVDLGIRYLDDVEKADLTPRPTLEIVP